MALVPIRDLMADALARGHAVGYFESWDVASLAGTIDAAERARSPVIVGFNGDFLTDPARRLPERIGWYGALGAEAARSAAVPCGLIFNECADDAAVREAIGAGFTLVMPIAGPGEARDAYAARTADIVALARPRGVAVEAEIGTLPHGAHGGGSATDPAEAAAFVAATGIDLLAVSAGNCHILLEGRRALDLGRIAAVREAAGVPLVLHGGTGIDDASLRAAIRLGVAKVNYGTVLKQAALRALRTTLASDEPDPHRLLGMGGPEDALDAVRVAVRDAVLEKIAVLGSRDRA